MSSLSSLDSLRSLPPPIATEACSRDDSNSAHHDDPMPPPQLWSHSGISIILTLTIVAFMIGFVADMMVSSRVANQMTLNLQDGARAEYLAKSGARFGQFLLSIDAGIDLKLASMAQQPIEDSHSDPWAMLNDFPIGGEEAEMLAPLMESFGLSQLIDDDVIDGLKDLTGSFTMLISDESSRINLSYLQKLNMGSNTKAMLNALLSCPSEQKFLEDRDLSASELVHRIFDFIDGDLKNTGESGFTSERAPYEDRTPRYNHPNHPLNSLHQLALVEGWNPEIHTVFSPYLTVYPIPNRYSSKGARSLGNEPYININTASRELLQCLFPLMNDDCYSAFVKSYAEKEDAKTAWENSSNIPELLSTNMCYTGDTKTIKASKWFTNRSSTFRIYATGRSGEASRVIEEVVQRLSPEQMKSKKTTSSLELLYRNHRAL